MDVNFIKQQHKIKKKEKKKIITRRYQLVKP